MDEMILSMDWPVLTGSRVDPIHDPLVQPGHAPRVRAGRKGGLERQRSHPAVLERRSSRCPHGHEYHAASATSTGQAAAIGRIPLERAVPTRFGAVQHL